VTIISGTCWAIGRDVDALDGRSQPLGRKEGRDDADRSEPRSATRLICLRESDAPGLDEVVGLGRRRLWAKEFGLVKGDRHLASLERVAGRKIDCALTRPRGQPAGRRTSAPAGHRSPSDASHLPAANDNDAALGRKDLAVDIVVDLRRVNEEAAVPRLAAQRFREVGVAVRLRRHVKSADAQNEGKGKGIEGPTPWARMTRSHRVSSSSPVSTCRVRASQPRPVDGRSSPTTFCKKLRIAENVVFSLFGNDQVKADYATHWTSSLPSRYVS
jgi:hypothetical protein